MKIKSVSPSRLKTWFMCPFKYHLTYETKEVLKTNFGAVHGTLIHDILEHHVKHGAPDWMERLKDGYRGVLEVHNRWGKLEKLKTPLAYAKVKEYRQVRPTCDSCCYKGSDICDISGEPLNQLNGCPKKLFDTSIAMVQDVLRRYKDIYGNPQSIIGTEYGFSVDLGIPELATGIIDLVVERDADTVVVYDYKAGKWTQDYDACREDLQCRMYSLAVRKAFIESDEHSYKNSILVFDYFTASPIYLSYSAEEDKQTEQHVVESVADIRNCQPCDVRRRIGSNFDWRCKSLCDPEICARLWPEFMEQR